MIEASSGTVEFAGADVRQLNGRALRGFRQAAQIVFQNADSSLNPRLSRDVLCSPRHPYTQALLAAVPQFRAEGFPAAAPAARGIPSAAEDAGAGCRFQVRCPHKITGICETVAPSLRRLSPMHHVACHLDAPSG